MSYFLIILSSLIWGVCPTIQSKALDSGASALNVVTYSLFFYTLNVVADCVVRKEDLRISKAEAFAFIRIGFAMFLTEMFLSMSYERIPVGLATMIHFTYPSLVCLANGIFYKEKLNHAAWFSIAFSIFGLFLLALDHLSGEIFGVLIAFASAVAYSYDLVCLDKSRIGRMSASKKVFYLTMARIVAVAVTNFLSMEQYSFAADQLIYCAIVGLGKSVAMLAFSKGLAQVGSSKASFVSALEPIVSLFVSKFVYGYALGLNSYLGCFFIVTATFFFVRNR